MFSRAMRNLLRRFPMNLLRAILLGYRFWNRIKDPTVRKKVAAAFGDGLITRKEWDGVGEDLGLFQKRG